jgi:tetratricopeptide (TPR) repeat protein
MGAAESSFREALAIYPAYAVACSELGAVLEQQDRLREAFAAFRNAVDADPKYIKPMVQLARLAGKPNRWHDELVGTWTLLRTVLAEGLDSVDRRLHECGSLQPERFDLGDTNERLAALQRQGRFQL